MNDENGTLTNVTLRTVFAGVGLSLDHNLEDKIVDLLFTNNKSSLQKNEILLGIGKSDHDIGFAEIDSQPCRISKPKRKIFLEKQTEMALDI